MKKDKMQNQDIINREINCRMNHEEIGSGWRKNHSNSNCNNTNLPRKNLCDFQELKTLYPLRWTTTAAFMG